MLFGYGQRKRGRGGLIVLFCAYFVHIFQPSLKKHGHFLTQKESACQISVNSEQLEKSQRKYIHTPPFHGALQFFFRRESWNIKPTGTTDGIYIGKTNWCINCVLLRVMDAFSSVLARPKWQGAAPCHFSSAPSFFQCPVIFREPFGFFGLLSALFWAWSCRKRPIKAKGGTIFVHHVVYISVGHRRHLGFTSQTSAWEWGCANGIWRNAIFAIVYLESGAGIYEY